jgi:tetratricopeptide (TPR) repeat protein
MLLKPAVVALASVCCAQAVPNLKRLTGPPPPEVGAWVDAANSHEPGVSDAPAIEAGRWSDARMRKVVLPRVRQLIGDTWDSDLAKRGAMLHTDIALFGLADSDLQGDDGVLRHRDSLSFGPARTDGHLDVARELLGLVQPKPALDADVELWYRAVAAWFFNADRLGDLTHHLDDGRRLFAGKAWFSHVDACLNETMASPRVEVLIGSSRRGSYLLAAERGFRQAVRLDPAMDEARVRLGHVLLARGQLDAAGRELRAALDSGGRSDLRYFAHLFLGRVEESSGRYAGAREAFESAARLFPLARAPIVALSRLAHAGGSRDDAAMLANRALDLPDRDGSDPWWTYDRCTAQDSTRLVGELRGRIASLRR